MVELIGPLFAAFVAQVHHGSGDGRQFTASTQEVGMNVRFGNVRDRQLLLTGNLKIDVDVSLCIDHHDVSCCLTAHHIAGVSKAGFVDLLEKHGWLSALL